MFRIVCDPSSGSIKLYLTEIRSFSLMFVVCLISVWQHNFEPVVYVYGTTVRELVLRLSYRTHTPLVQKLCWTPIKHTTNISETLWISVKYSFILPVDGSHTIWNMSGWSLIVCLLNIFI